MNTLQRNIASFVLIVIAAIGLAFTMLPAQKAGANLSEFCPTNLYSNATSTGDYLAAAGVTTFTITNCSNGATAFESIVLALQVTSSSTVPSLAISPEVSNDNTNWYPISTTTNALISGGLATYTWTGNASSTSMAGTGVSAGTASSTAPLYNLAGARWHVTFQVDPVPMPYVRFRIVNAGTAPVVVFATTEAKREMLAR